MKKPTVTQVIVAALLWCAMLYVGFDVYLLFTGQQSTVGQVVDGVYGEGHAANAMRAIK